MRVTTRAPAVNDEFSLVERLTAVRKFKNELFFGTEKCLTQCSIINENNQSCLLGHSARKRSRPMLQTVESAEGRQTRQIIAVH